ncbi:MAG: trypsin-like peptidase domain-containing protein [Acidobacteriota bacterium]
MRWRIALLVAAVASASCGLSLNARLKVGDSLEARIESPHPIRGGMWSQEVILPGATFLKFHLDTLDLGPEDLFLLHDGEGATVFSHVGPLDARWLPSVEGERAKLEVWSGEGSMPWGLVVDGLARGTERVRAESGHVDPESICGSNDSRDPACYGPSLRSAGDAVGRMLFEDDGGGWYLCTGSLVSPYEHFLTNNHCVDSESEANSLEVRWRYQYSGCGAGVPATETVSTGAHFLSTSQKLDYSLLYFDSDAPAARYGHLTLGTSTPASGTRIWIPQHPGGSPKRFAVASDLDAGGNATIQAVNLKGNAKNTDVGYFADTEGGSSGSPVLTYSEPFQVVALHHFGTGGAPCGSSAMNQGVDIGKIAPEVSPYLEAPQAASMKKVATPSFRFVVTGTHFTPSTTVAIDGAAWTSVTYKSSTKLVIKGGAALKSEVPKNTPATFTFANPGIPPASFVWQWP